MANKKRQKSTYVKKLNRFRLHRADLIAIEKILWVYADAREMKHAGVAKLPEGRRHMPRAAVDRYASIGRYRPFHLTIGWGELGVHFAGVDWIYKEDSVKFFSKRGYPKRVSYLELRAWPGIRVTFTPFSTEIYAQTHYATGKELLIMKEVANNIEIYLQKCRKSKINVCSLLA